MIYQFKRGPLDGEEWSIPEMPIGTIFRHPLPPAIGVISRVESDDWGPPPEARYRVTDIGEMTFDHYQG